MSIFTIVVLIISVMVHEVSHGYAALWLGDPTAKYQGRLSLNPIKHLDLYGSIIVPLLLIISKAGFIIGWAKPVPFNPYNLKPEKWGLPARAGEALVAIAGPLSNFLLAIVFGLFIRFSGNLEMATGETFLSLMAYVVLINIVLAIFNLVPIPPLDGSKILFAFLPYKWQGFKESLERYGLIIVLLFVFLFWSVLNPVINFLFNLFVGL